MTSRIQVFLECVAVISKDNKPILVKNYTQLSELDIHYFAYISLDGFEEQEASSKDRYLGKIFSIENTSTYAYRSITGVKFLMVVRWQGLPPGEELIEQTLANMCRAYMELCCNPFYIVEVEIERTTGEKFLKMIEGLDKKFSTSI